MSRHLSRHAGCEQARAWASVELDGELSQLERELLAAHLRDCAACASFARRTWALTHLVRAAPLETPQRRLDVLPVEPPRRRRRAAALQVAVAATLAVFAAGVGVLVGSLTRAPAEPAPVPAGPVALLPSTLPNPSRAQDRSPRAQPDKKKPARVGSEPGLSRRPTSSSGV
jgi:predicted anti-sigma-YlaC factor YlaD